MNSFSRFLGLLALIPLQVLVLNNIHVMGYVNPYVYISFVFLYPLTQKRINFLTLAFFYGLTIDYFSDTGGIHAFATVFIAYIRLGLLKIVFKKSNLDFLLFNIQEEPINKVFNYVVILTVIHHFILFSLANFSFQNFSHVIVNTVFSSVFTLVLYFLGAFIFRRKKP